MMFKSTEPHRPLYLFAGSKVSWVHYALVWGGLSTVTLIEPSQTTSSFTHHISSGIQGVQGALSAVADRNKIQGCLTVLLNIFQLFKR